MLLGAWLVGNYEPESWIREITSRGYRAAFFPVESTAAPDVVDAYVAAARNAGVIIAETGAWSNPLSADAATRRAALEKCKAELALSDRIGAKCCVNISGSRGERWDGPDTRNLTDETFGMVVDATREIIDAVKPTRAFYTLEPMPWMYPDSAESYLRLIKAVDRKAFAVHFDPVNMISSIDAYYHNGRFIADFLRRLGPWVKSCHAKDISLADELTVHLSEVRPGQGALSYKTYLSEMSKLPADTPLMIEHLKTNEDFDLSAGYIRGVASELGIKL
jgi:sugar phosphate isomerase/epimerase